MYEPEQLELRRVITDQGQIVVTRFGQQRAVEGRFADQWVMRFVLDPPTAELLSERLLAGECRLVERLDSLLQFLRRPQQFQASARISSLSE